MRTATLSMTFLRRFISGVTQALLAGALTAAVTVPALAQTGTQAGASDTPSSTSGLTSASRIAGFIPVPPASDTAVLPPTPMQKLTNEIVDDNLRLPTIDLTVQPTDLWQRIRNGFGMPNLEDPLVTNRQAWYLNRPDYLRNTLNRSRRYLYHIVEELEKRGMPTELALLPVVESSYNPQAYSPARALGMWQFIPSTGKNYKLEQNWWLDERRDILASTNAALEYLQNIYEMNGDWHVALASYNWGEGAVARAMAKNAAQGLPTDYLSLKMPTETRYYVPKLQAIKNIIADPELFNFRLDPIPNKPYFGTVDVGSNMDVAVAARLADIPLTEFIALNPAYSRPVIPGSSENPLVLPADKVSTFLANLGQYQAADKPLSSWLTYQLKPKEKLDAVAGRFGVTGTRLRQLNGITKRTKVMPGMTLLVPGRGVLQADDVTAAMPKTPEIPTKPEPVGKGGKGNKKGKKETTDTAAVKPAGKSTGKPAIKLAGKPNAKGKTTGKAAPKTASKVERKAVPKATVKTAPKQTVKAASTTPAKTAAKPAQKKTEKN